VGHETDFTICDFAADARAPTPSAAAELAVPNKCDLALRLGDLRRNLGRALQAHNLALRNRLTRCAGSYVFREPRNLLERYRERLDLLARAKTRSLQALFQQRRQRLDDLAASRVFREPEDLLRRYRERITMLSQTALRHLQVLVRLRRQRTADLNLRLERAGRTAAQRLRQDLRRLQGQLNAFNPAAVLERGYSLTRTLDGVLVRRAGEVAEGQVIITRLARGALSSRVEAITEDESDGHQEEG
jgi:exodeoxyribonuclease VII large subunit